MPPALGGALDRMAQFVAAPLFARGATEKELHAIDSEHKKNLKDESRRAAQLMRDAVRPGHPMRQFRTGNLETLRDRPLRGGVDVRAALLAFHKKWYSADRMALAVCAPHSLDELEELAVRAFSGVPRRALADPEFAADPFASLPHLQYARPVQDTRRASFAWLTRDWRRHWRSSPGSYWSHLLGHEGPGSVLSVLKGRGLATGLSAGEQLSAGGFGLWCIHVSLTNKGSAPSAVAEIGEVIFAYLAMCRGVGAQRHPHWEEMRHFADLEFRFRRTPDPDDCTSALSGDLLWYPPGHVISGPCLFADFCAADINAHLAELTPSRLRVTVVYPAAPQCTRKERWYGTPHSPVLPVPPAWLRRWESPAACDGMHLPAPNPFVPKDLALRAPAPAAAAEYPSPLGGGAAWRGFFLQDQRYGERKVFLRLFAYSPWVAESTLNYVLADAWARAVE